MTATLTNSVAFRIHVTAAAPAAPLAILSIASVLGIEPQQAADRMASLPTVLAEDVAPPVARRLSALLMALGHQVRLDPALSPVSADLAEPVDLAVQASGTVDQGTVERLGRVLERHPDDVRNGLWLPGGLILKGQTAERAVRLRRALRRERSLRLVVSAAPTAVYDAFERPGVPAPTAELKRLGLAPCPLTGAVGTGLNGPTAAFLARRMEGRLVILDRAFQRFDLYLRKTRGVEPADLERFLAARPTARKAQAPCAPRLVDADLSYRAALQFAADYALIGLDVDLSLRGSRQETF